MNKEWLNRVHLADYYLLRHKYPTEITGRSEDRQIVLYGKRIRVLPTTATVHYHDSENKQRKAHVSCRRVPVPIKRF